jgi:hypothetical protein
MLNEEFSSDLGDGFPLEEWDGSFGDALNMVLFANERK